MWMACYTQQEIAKEEGIHQTIVGDVLRENESSRFPLKPAANHEEPFERPLYNVWKQQEKTPPSTSSIRSTAAANWASFS
jgi:hypothetical protein